MEPFFGTLLSTFFGDFFSISLLVFFGNLFWHSFGYFFMGMNFHCHHFEYFIMLQDSFVHFFWASFQSFLFFYPSFQHTFENVSGRMNFFFATFADVETMCSGLAPFAQFALVRRGLFSPLQVGSCGQGVNVCICQKFECALSEVVDKTFPCEVCGFSCC